LKNGDKRSPDVSFVAKERLQGLKHPPRGFFQGSPDLAVEILLKVKLSSQDLPSRF
jgi:Uma2 family endonuclease